MLFSLTLFVIEIDALKAIFAWLSVKINFVKNFCFSETRKKYLNESTANKKVKKLSVNYSCINVADVGVHLVLFQDSG